jgi:hypothetical protein
LKIVMSGFKSYWAGTALACMVAAPMHAARAGGVSGYLPLNLEPEMERQIERVLIRALSMKIRTAAAPTSMARSDSSMPA